MPCPQNINRSGTFSAYNRKYTDGSFNALTEYVQNTSMQGSAGASKCIGCGKCEKHCPQNIEIRKELKNAEKELEGSVYKTMDKLITKFSKPKNKQ
jgi:predicted aldo/keto reductase-like oxidoreductase